MNGRTFPLLPAILGKIGSSPHKETVSIYGHFDVQPTAKSDGWDTSRSTSRSRTTAGAQTIRAVTYEERDGAAGQPRVLLRRDGGERERGSLSPPSYSYPELRLHARWYLFPAAGVFGRTVYEPMTDLIALMVCLVSPAGNILVPGVDDMLDYSIADVESALISEKVQVLMVRMRLPSLSLHGIEGTFAGPGAKTVIPARVGGKFSIRDSLSAECGDPPVISIFVFVGFYIHLKSDQHT
ncbi:hypothetical protein B0H13DRAFT_2548720 [Mycena leptocephala]|nr:hypothetical protein B0H13DRAFT_2548720 [Mycena leptocephala]